MSFKFLISFAIGLGVYLLALFVWGLIKRHMNKKKVENEDSQHEKQEDSESKK